jgi:hypothetical protein
MVRLSVESIELDITHRIPGSHWHGHLNIQLLVGIFSDPRVLNAHRLLPGGHDLIFEVLMAGKTVNHILSEGILEAQLPRRADLASPQRV